MWDGISRHFVIDHSADGLTFHSSSNAQTILALWAKANIEEYAMELDSHEISLLKCLADEWIKSGPPGLVETAMIAKSLDMTIPDTRSTIHTLFVKGLVGTDKYDLYAAYLTPEGFDIARSNGPDDDGGPDA
jgi:hypothetical protein